jgi:peptidyl-prolyl cis-trans isomerase SurA
MKRFRMFIIQLVMLPVIMMAQNSGDEILMTIHDRQITLEEFERIYRKNNSSTALEQQSVDEYLDLFINFKLKVIEAEEQGLDTTSGFLREFNGYKAQLAKPYLSDKEEVEMLKREAFDRAQKELHGRHILIRLDENASPEDTTSAWDKAHAIRDRIIAGEDFGMVARATSDDPSARTNSGDLGWFTVFRMIYPFETAAYETARGGISMPVRTRFGYHLIQILDERPARGQVQVAHIMVMVPESMSGEDKNKARQKIMGLYDSINSGMEFPEVASRYSEDRGSASRGGELPWFGTGRMVTEFEDAAFALKEIGDVSTPVQTSFGWHIIKLLDRKPVSDYDAMEADLQSNVTTSDRITYARKAMIRRIKENNKYEEYPGNLQPFYQRVDSSFFQRTWNAGRASGLTDPLFVIGDDTIRQDAFTDFLNRNQGGRQSNIEVFVNNMYERFVEETVLKYEEEQLPEKYPEFRHLVQEYHDGILLFDLTDKLVWSKAVADTTGLENFYENNKDRYMWGERMDATLYTCRDKEVAGYAMDLIRAAKRRIPGPEEILSATIQDFQDSTCISIESRKFEKGDHDLVDNMDWDETLSGMVEENGKTVFLVKNTLIKPEPRRLDEARGLVTADYQNHLEKEWIQSLREKYDVRVNRELLSGIKE